MEEEESEEEDYETLVPGAFGIMRKGLLKRGAVGAPGGEYRPPNPLLH